MEQIWQGRCHCGRARFEVRADIDHVRVCNCSICLQRGALIFRVEESALTHLTPLEELRCYRWGSQTGCDYFCPHCGILPFRRPSTPTDAERAAGAEAFEGWAVNTRCLTDFEPASVPVRQIDGAAIGGKGGV